MVEKRSDDTTGTEVKLKLDPNGVADSMRAGVTWPKKLVEPPARPCYIHLAASSPQLDITREMECICRPLYTQNLLSFGAPRVTKHFAFKA